VAGRFSNLEFDDRSDRSETPAKQAQPRTTSAAAATTASAAARGKFDAASFLERAIAEYRWGRFEPALRFYTRCLEQDRTVIAAWVGQVQMLVQLDECREACVWSDKALELFRSNGDLLAARAQACIRLADRKAALASSDAAFQSPGSSPGRWIARGEVLLARGDKHAEHCFQKALLEPAADWFDRAVIGRIYLHYRQATNAIQHIASALERQPGHGYLWFLRGQCEAALAMTGTAADSYRRCLDARPDYSEAEAALQALGSISFGRRLLGFLRRRRLP